MQIRLDVLNFSNNEDAKIEWPASAKDSRDDTDPDTDGDQKADIAELKLDKDASDGNGKFAIYTYTDLDSMPTDRWSRWYPGQLQATI